MTRRDRIAWGTAGVLAGLGLLVTWGQAQGALVALGDVGRGSVARYVAASHAQAAHGAMGWALAIALVLGGSAREVRSRPAPEAVGCGVVLGALALWAGVPRLGLAAAGVAASGALRGAARSYAVGAACLVAAYCAAEGGLAQTLAPDEASNLAQIGPAYLVRSAVLGVAVVWGAARALRGAWSWSAAGGAAATVGLGLLTWGRAAAAVLDWGPTQALGPLQSGAVAVGASAERFLGGCVWSRVGDGWERLVLGHVSQRHGITGCPEGPVPRLADRPTLRLEANTPAEVLVGLGVGEAHLLGTIGDHPVPGALRPWRWGVQVVQHLDPEVLRWRPLPNPRLVPAGADHPEVAELLAGAPLRVDLVFLAERDFGLGAAVELCAQARATHPGVRCAVGSGPAERWR